MAARQFAPPLLCLVWGVAEIAAMPLDEIIMNSPVVVG